MLPFTREQFLAVFMRYNEAVWPAQIVAYLLGIATVILVFVPTTGRNRLVALGLAAMWGWTGIVYHWGYFSAINQAAPLFAALFVLQAVLFLYYGAIRERLKFRASRGPRAWVGWALVAYAAMLYPLVGFWIGHSFEEVPMFGITPCPVTIFTLGLLLLAGIAALWIALRGARQAAS